MNTEKSPLISVIVPVYKVEKYLPVCLDSLLAQTYRNFELLLVDDGSPDGCWQIMQQYAAQDSRVRIFSKENGGVSSARNFGLEQARGEYICFVDSDDFVAPQYLEWMYRAIKQTNTELAVCGYRKVSKEADPAGIAPAAEEPEIKIFSLEEYSFDYTQCEAANQYVWCILYKRSLCKGLHFDEQLFIGEDTFFFVQVLLQAKGLALVKTPLYFYRIWPESACRRPFTQKHYTAVETWSRIYEMVQQTDPLLKNSAEQMLVFACAHAYYRMLEAHYPDKKLRASAVQTVRTHKAAVRRMETKPRWKLWDKARLLSMLYLPAWFNGAFWCRAEQLRAKHRHRTGSLQKTD